MGIQINGQTDTVTATDGSINVGGDVTIPGVLTYEDVTNVDSVGVITARDGIIVTGGSVGIGTTNAGSNALSVHGRTILGKVATNDAISKAEMVSKAALRIRPHVTNSGALNFAQVNTGSSIGVQYTNGSGTADWDIALQPYGGSVGIGTDAPGQKLDIDGNIRLRAGNTTTYATTLKSNLNATHTSSLTSNVNNVTEFELIGSYADSGGSNPRVVLAAGGQKVGIGTNNPYARNHIEINVNAGAGNGSAGALWLKNANQTANNSATIFFGNNVSQAAGAINFIHKDYSTNAGDITFDTRANGSTYAERLRIDSSGNVKIGSISNHSLAETQTPVYIAMQTDITAFGDDEGGASAGLVRIEEIGSNNNRYHGIELRNTNSGDIRFLNQDVGVANRGDLIIAMPDGDADVGLHNKIRFNSSESSIQISGKGGAVAANTSTQHTDIYIATKTGVTAVDTGVGAEIAGLIRFEDIGSNNSRYHGIEIRNRNSGDIRILNLDEGTTNKASMVFAIDNSGVTEALRLNSSGNAVFAGTVSDSIGPLRRLGITNHNASTLTLAATHAGNLIREATNSANITLPQNVFTAGDMITIFNVSSGDNTITEGTGVTLYNTADAATGNRTLAAKGVCTIACTSSNEFIISGSGLS